MSSANRSSNHLWVSAFLFLALIIPALAFANPSTSNTAEQHTIKQALLNATAKADSFRDHFAAQVWLLDMSTRLESFMPDPQQRLEFLRLVHQEASIANLPPEIVLAVIHVESTFQRISLSSAGAQGYMQVMPFWKNEIGRPDDNLMTTQTNLRYGCTILKHYLDRENGHWPAALARYNGSYGSLAYAEKVLSKWQQYWFVAD